MTDMEPVYLHYGLKMKGGKAWLVWIKHPNLEILDEHENHISADLALKYID